MSTVATDISVAPDDLGEHHSLGVMSWDWTLFFTTILLAGLGLLMILSASSLSADAMFGDAMHFVTRQVAGLGLGVMLGLGVLAMPWTKLRSMSWPAYGVTILLLLAVMSPLGHSVNGATRWVKLGFINFQPSELAKLTLVWVMAHYLSCNSGRLRDVLGVVVPASRCWCPCC